MSTDSVRRLLTESEAALYLGIAPITLRKARQTGKRENRIESPPFIRAGGRCVRYDVRDLDQWIERHKSDDSVNS